MHGITLQTLWLTQVTVILSLQCIVRTKDKDFHTAMTNSQEKKKTKTFKNITKNKTQVIKVLYQLSIDRTCA